MIEADRADYNRAKLDHDLIVAITIYRCNNGKLRAIGIFVSGMPVSPCLGIIVRSSGSAMGNMGHDGNYGPCEGRLSSQRPRSNGVQDNNRLRARHCCWS